MSKSPQSGVTLIEIMIAVSLLSLLSVGMLIAMRLGFTTMDKTDAKLVMNRRVANSRQIVENEINGYMYSQAYFHPRPLESNYVTFLEAEPQRMRFVTSYSINESWRGRPQIAVMQVIPGDKNDGVRLILNETPYTGPEQTGQQITSIEPSPLGPPAVHYRPVDADSQSFVLADRLAYCRFTYLETLYEAPFQIWRVSWTRPDRLPKAVRLEMAPLDARPGELRPTTIDVQFPLTRQPAITYADYTPAPQQ
jgi:prepilin-type N-terminal cleavage/methylation domain-containing protein